MDAIFTVPCLVVLAIAAALGVRSSSKHGTPRGLWTFAKSLAVGVAILFVLWVAFVIDYYRGGGH